MAAPVLPTGVADTLGREIADGILAPGGVLTLEQIQDRFGVSRTVARDAMRILESLRMVQPKRKVGLTVLPRDEWDVFSPTLIDWRLRGPGVRAQLKSLTELRAAIEPVAASAAAVNADTATRARLVPLAAKMRERGEAGDLEAFLELDIAFHQSLLRASGNEMFAALTDVVAVVLSARTSLGLMPEHPEPEALAAHEDVARAVRDSDPVTAERAMTVITAEVRSTLGGLTRAVPVDVEHPA